MSPDNTSFETDMGQVWLVDKKILSHQYQPVVTKVVTAKIQLFERRMVACRLQE
jgi:hypothetical protein